MESGAGSGWLAPSVAVGGRVASIHSPAGSSLYGQHGCVCVGGGVSARLSRQQCRGRCAGRYVCVGACLRRTGKAAVGGECRTGPA